MPTFIKTGYWDKLSRAPKGYLNLDFLAAQSNVISLTKAELDIHVANNTLVPGAMYEIDGVDVPLYGGTTVFLQAATTNELALAGHGIFYNPKYLNSQLTPGNGYGVWNNYIYPTIVFNLGETFNFQDVLTTNNGAIGIFLNTSIIQWLSGDWSVATTVSNGSGITATISGGVNPSYNVGDSVIWGGKHWTNVTGNVGTATNKYILSSVDWTAVSFNETNYNIVADVIHYDYSHDMIIRRKDKWDNDVDSNYVNITTISNLLPSGIIYGNPIKDFQWGNGPEDYYGGVNDVYIGVFSNYVKDSYLECINFIGRVLAFTTLTEESIFWNNPTGKNTTIYYNKLSLYGLIVNNGWGNGSTHPIYSSLYIYNNEVNSSSSIESNSINTNSFTDNVINNSSSIYSNTISSGSINYNILNNGCSINSNILNNSYIDGNTLSNYSDINSNTLTDSSIQSNTLTDSSIQSNTLNICSIQSNTLNNSYIQSNTLNNGYIQYNTLIRSYIQSNTLNNSYIQYNTLNNSYISDNTLTLNSYISDNTLNNSIIQYNTLNINSNISENTLDKAIVNENILYASSTINNNTLTNDTEIFFNTLNFFSTIHYNILNSVSIIEDNTLSNSNIYSNTLTNNSIIVSNILNYSFIQYNTLNNSSTFNFSSSGTLSNKGISEIEASFANATFNISAATIIFTGIYSKQMFKNSAGTTQLGYYNGSNVFTVVNVNA